MHCTKAILTYLLIFVLSIHCIAQVDPILIRDLKELSSEKMEGRGMGTKGHSLAQQYIIDEFEKSRVVPLSESYKQEFAFHIRGREIKGTNIIGKIKGRTERTIVISAHYDHLGRKKEKIYYGADDNASGVAALFYMARYFSENLPKHTIIFAAFDGEELGKLGSQHFVSSTNIDNIVMNINMDMISRNDNKEIYASGTHHYPRFKETLNKIASNHSGVTIKFGHDGSNKKEGDWTYLSDQGPFHSQGIPYVYFGVEDHNDYHKSTDIFDKIDTTFYNNVVKMILDFVKEIDQQDLRK
ncbi:MAG: M28 family peptidase [Cyclobacteriaceae bacterium]